MIKRLFIAIEPDRNVIDSIHSLQKELQRLLPFKGIRWVDPSLFHITLRFLGDTDVRQIPKLVSLLNSAAETRPSFSVVFEGVGHFSSRGALRTIWAGTRGKVQLEQLFDTVHHCTGFLQPDQKQRYSPHLTLARGSDRLTRQESALIIQTLSAYNETFFGETYLTGFELFESTLTPTGPVYKKVQSFNLG